MGSMSRHVWLLYLFLFAVRSDLSKGDDFDDANCKPYVAIAEKDYDRNPKSVEDLSKRPLGFMSVTIPFVTNNANAQNPCFKLSLENSTMQTVEALAISAVGSSSFCIKSQPPYQRPTCQTGIKTCQDSPIGYDSIKYVFYCNGCESDLTIWFRLTVSPSYTNGLDFERFCQREAEYPDSLIPLPILPSQQTSPTSLAYRTSFSLTFSWLLPLALLFV